MSQTPKDVNFTALAPAEIVLNELPEDLFDRQQSQSSGIALQNHLSQAESKDSADPVAPTNITNVLRPRFPRIDTSFRRSSMSTSKLDSASENFLMSSSKNSAPHNFNVHCQEFAPSHSPVSANLGQRSDLDQPFRSLSLHDGPSLGYSQFNLIQNTLPNSLIQQNPNFPRHEESSDNSTKPSQFSHNKSANQLLDIQRDSSRDLIRAPLRPGQGLVGRKITLRANFFPIHSLPTCDIHHYEMEFNPEISHTKTTRRLFSLWTDLNRSSILRNIAPVFDGRKNVYTSRAIPFLDEISTFELEIADENEDYAQFVTNQKYLSLSIQFMVGEINMDPLHAFLHGEQQPFPTESFKALDTILRHRPSMLYTSIGRCFFSRDGATSIAGGAELWQGFHQSLKAVSGKLVLNVDLASTAFFEP
ncbi:Eukaryotic translation initiation factor 2C, partial [Nowakowskiella sp. JEL0078]